MWEDGEAWIQAVWRTMRQLEENGGQKTVSGRRGKARLTKANQEREKDLRNLK